MLLPADGMGLSGISLQRLDIVGRVEPEGVEMIPRREGLDPREQRVVNAARQHEVTEHPVSPHGELSERHADLERNARFFGQDRDRAEALKHRQEAVEDVANGPRPPFKMMIESPSRAGMALVAVGESAAAMLALP